MTPRQLIVSTMRERYTQADEKYRRAAAEEAGLIAAANVWDNCNPADGVGSFGTNPYNGQLTSAALTTSNCLAALQRYKAAYELAVDTFLGPL